MRGISHERRIFFFFFGGCEDEEEEQRTKGNEDAGREREMKS